MATLLPALLTKFDNLTASGFAGSARPPIFHDEAPQVVAAQLRPPYVVVSVDSENFEPTFEDAVEETRVMLEVYATSEADLDLAIAAIRFNGGSSTAGLGFDYGTLPALTDGALLVLAPTAVPTKHYEGTDHNGLNVWRGELGYLVTVQRG